MRSSSASPSSTSSPRRNVLLEGGSGLGKTTLHEGSVAHGLIYYYIRWQVDQESHVASSPVFERADVPSEGNVTPDDELAFAACVKEYLAANDRVVLPHGGANGEAWGMRAAFPLSDSALLKMIAKAKAEPGSQAPSTTSHQ